MQVKCVPMLDGKYSFWNCVNLEKLAHGGWPFTNFKTAHHPHTVFPLNKRWLLNKDYLKLMAEAAQRNEIHTTVPLQIGSGQMALSHKDTVNPKKSFG